MVNNYRVALNDSRIIESFEMFFSDESRAKFGFYHCCAFYNTRNVDNFFFAKTFDSGSSRNF